MLPFLILGKHLPNLFLQRPRLKLKRMAFKFSWKITKHWFWELYILSLIFSARSKFYLSLVRMPNLECSLILEYKPVLLNLNTKHRFWKYTPSIKDWGQEEQYRAKTATAKKRKFPSSREKKKKNGGQNLSPGTTELGDTSIDHNSDSLLSRCHKFLLKVCKFTVSYCNWCFCVSLGYMTFKSKDSIL